MSKTNTNPTNPNIKTIKIDNFNLNLFGNLLNQSLTVTPQLMLEFRDNMIKSCSFSSTKSLVKLWTIPVSSFIVSEKPTNQTSITDLDDFTEDIVKNSTIDENFNFYILKGDLFKKYIGVFNQTSVNLEFTIKLIDGKFQATSILINGKSENGSPLTTTFALTTEELISNVISDYAEILTECTPTQDMFEILLQDKQISEIKSLVKNLRGSSVENVQYLTFEITQTKIIVYDKVFVLEFSIDENIQNKNSINNYKNDVSLIFNVLKSDFALIGDHSFSIFTKDNSEKVIFGGNYGKSLIWCLTTKFDTNKQLNSNDASEADDLIDSLDLAEYELDLPF